MSVPRGPPHRAAAQRAQAALAGAGNIIAWEEGKARHDRRADAVGSSAPGVSAAAPEAAPEPRGDAGPLHSLQDVARVYELLASDSAVPATSAAVAAVASTPASDSVPAHRPRSRSSAVADGAAVAPSSARSWDADDRFVTTQSRVRTSLASQHSAFIHIMASRLTEARTVAAMWTSTTSTLAGYLAALKFLHTAAHESVAVDVLHAAAACNGVRMAVARDDVPDAVPGPAKVQVGLVGGLPLWHSRDFPIIHWVTPVCTILESILYSNYEDYLTIGATVMGHVLDALAPLFSMGARCSERDLSALHAAAEEDEGHGSGGEESKFEVDVDDDVTSLSRAQRRALRHIAARQCVDATRATFPLLAALAHAAAHGGRCAKLTAPRVTRLRAMHDSVRHLVAAAAFQHAPGVEHPRTQPLRQALPSARYEDAAAAGRRPEGGNAAAAAALVIDDASASDEDSKSM